jgi:hypothetical protein
LEINRDGSQNWEKINLPLTKWTDTTKQPAIPTEWIYRGTYIRSGHPVGQHSPEVKIIVKA